MTGIDYIAKGSKEGFCPRCYDFRPGSVTVMSPPDIAGWRCKQCGFTCEACDRPHDPEQAKERFAGEIDG